ncbi:unnamed protein product [Ceutorhynchus assimilis]|uniref:Uncharacterized protein n=1 Tax=Ceutorhynchus assimilis TaxID=467358 RepID=A0A9N9MNS2_9CUCU|nr:unnamed protein product [Ceutorhynchus assimilis]
MYFSLSCKKPMAFIYELPIRPIYFIKAMCLSLPSKKLMEFLYEVRNNLDLSSGI